MGCFIVPATEAIVTTVVAKTQKTKEEKCEIKRSPPGSKPCRGSP